MHGVWKGRGGGGDLFYSERFFPFEIIIIIIIIKLFTIEEKDGGESFLFIFIFDDFEYYSFSRRR